MLNLVTQDAQTIVMIIPFVNYLWFAPVAMIVALVLLYFTIGWQATLCGFGIMILFIPIIGIIVSQFST